MKSHTLGTFVLGGLTSMLICIAAGCLPPQQTVKTVKDSVKLAQDACVIIRDVAPDNKAGQEICAKEEELRPYIKLILGGRVRPSGSGSAQ